MSDIRVYHGFRSPYSRLGLHIIKKAGLDVTLIPFTGPADGAVFQDPLANKPKLAYYALDVPRMTMRMGLKIASPNPFEVDFEPANRALIAAANEGKALDFAIAVSDARWGDGKNISDLDVLRACATSVWLDAGLVDTAQDDAAITKALQDQRALIEEDKVFGVPFAVRGASKYWGHDRFELLVEDAG